MCKFVDIETWCKLSIYFEISASIQPRKGHPKFLNLERVEGPELQCQGYAINTWAFEKVWLEDPLPSSSFRQHQRSFYRFEHHFGVWHASYNHPYIFQNFGMLKQERRKERAPGSHFPDFRSVCVYRSFRFCPRLAEETFSPSDLRVLFSALFFVGTPEAGCTSGLVMGCCLDSWW